MKTLHEAEEEIVWEFGQEVVPKYIGEDMFLLLGLSDTRAEETSVEEVRHGSTPFYMLEKWNPSMKTGQRLIWVQCWGIPMIAWDVEHIKKMVAVIGEPVEVDDDVDELRRLDRARVLVRTAWRPPLQHTINICIADETHQVHIVEEVGPENHCCRCHARDSGGSSEEVESEESDAGEQIRNTVEEIDAAHARHHIGGDCSEGSTRAGHQRQSPIPIGPCDELRGNNPSQWEHSANPNDTVAIDLEAAKGAASAQQISEEGGTDYTNEEKGSDQKKVYEEDIPKKIPAAMAFELVSVEHAPQFTVHLNKSFGGPALTNFEGPRALNARSNLTNNTREEIGTAWEGYISKEDDDLEADESGPPILGLTKLNTPVTQKKQNLSPVTNKNENRALLMVYSRNKGRKKQQQNQKNEDKADIANQDHSELGLENFSMIRKEAETPNSKLRTSPDDNPQELQEAEHHWQMIQQMGVTADTNHERFIEMISDMENRDRKEAEKLGNRSVPHEYFNL